MNKDSGGMADTFGEELRALVKHLVTGDMFDKVVMLDFEDSGTCTELYVMFEGDDHLYEAGAYGEFNSFMEYNSWWQINWGERHCARGKLLDVLKEAVESWPSSEKRVDFVMDVINCARCGGLHKEVEVFRFAGSLPASYSHWAMCPHTQQPVLVSIHDAETGEVTYESRV